MSTRFESATRGASAPISVWNRYAYASREEARRAGALNLLEDFREIEGATDSVTSESEKRTARQIIAQLERVLTPQMELFLQTYRSERCLMMPATPDGGEDREVR